MKNIEIHLARLAYRLYRSNFSLYKSLYFKYKRFSDYQTVNFLNKHICQGMNVMDIGANIGFYTLHMAARVGNEGKVHSFEPCQDTYNRLLSTTATHRNVVLNMTGIWDKSGKAYMNYSPTGSIDNWLNKQPEETDENQDTVKVVTLDDYCDQNQFKPDFAKMDIQGAELHALKGFKHTLAKSSSMIMIIELWPYGLQRCGASAHELIDFLNSLDFKLSLINGEPVSKFNCSDNAQGNYVNIAAIK